MKKIFLVVAIIATLSLTGCGSMKDKELKDNFVNDVNGLKSYYMEGTLTLTNNDDNYKYDVEVSYKKDDKYKVSLKNKANNYEQIILKNDDGVYVITPSLNKSFKFQSDWPNNNSQSYLLDSVAKDLKDDAAYKFTQKDNDYVFTTKTNYPNNPKYVKQNIVIDKNGNLKKVEVQDENDTTYINFTVEKLDKKAKFSNDQFNLDEITKNFDVNNDENENSENEKTNSIDNKTQNTQTTNAEDVDTDDEDVNKSEEDTTNNNINTNNNENQSSNTSINNNDESNKTNETSKIDENVFPLYLPSNTSLKDKEVIETSDGERVIMTFGGDNPFILVQETIKPSANLEIIPTYGEPFMLIDTVGSLTDTSYTWTSGGVEYYIVSDQLDKGELLEVAKSINVVSTLKEK